ncbi:heme-binding protein [Gluconobacter sphaericus]|uniref:heme-binding protein n=1 Tax=Gluconobacter sphaericus TaxID=574987 RepID=UPI001B8BC19D|nr:heme-binding protein [Gluconobacter sphaericus]
MRRPETLHSDFDLAQERQVNLSIILIDRSGVLLALDRMDEAPVVTVDVAIGKARTAVCLPRCSRT